MGQVGVGRDLAVKKWLGLRSGRGQVKEEEVGVPRPEERRVRRGTKEQSAPGTGAEGKNVGDAAGAVEVRELSVGQSVSQHLLNSYRIWAVFHAL